VIAAFPAAEFFLVFQLLQQPASWTGSSNGSKKLSSTWKGAFSLCFWEHFRCLFSSSVGAAKFHGFFRTKKRKKAAVLVYSGNKLQKTEKNVMIRLC